LLGGAFGQGLVESGQDRLAVAVGGHAEAAGQPSGEPCPAGEQLGDLGALTGDLLASPAHLCEDLPNCRDSLRWRQCRAHLDVRRPIRVNMLCVLGLDQEIPCCDSCSVAALSRH
jgi:hypothetical protein